MGPLISALAAFAAGAMAMTCLDSDLGRRRREPHEAIDGMSILRGRVFGARRALCGSPLSSL